MTTSRIRIDGLLDDEDWGRGEAVSRFVQVEPAEGEPASERTEVRVLIGRDALYLGARMWDRSASSIRRRLARRDELVDSDAFEVAIDSRHDHLSAFVFRVTPAGTIRDAVIGSGGRPVASWDPVWESSVKMDEQGWTAEMRIPLSQLRYGTSPADSTWGLQLTRVIFRNQETAVFSFTPRRDQGGVSRFGHLVGLGRLPLARHVEVLAHAVGRADRVNVATGDPFKREGTLGVSMGADLRYNPTGTLTLDATINPDFGQVEQDPAVVNLSAFETFYAERRRFFADGSDLFGFGQLRAMNSLAYPQLTFSRRIGRAPQRVPRGGGIRFVDAPRESTIAGAAKLTGTGGDGWSLGILGAATAEERARYLDASGVTQVAPVEPATGYLMGRVRRELRGGSTLLGGVVTAVERAVDDAGPLGSLPRRAVTAGVDLNHEWDERRWAFDANLAASSIAGSEAALQLVQRSSVRYFQRPDADAFALDGSRRQLDGHAYQLSLTRTAGVHWRGSVAYQQIAPGFEANDLGYQTRADQRILSPIVAYQENAPRAFLRRYELFLFSNHAWNFDGDLIYHGAGLVNTLQTTDYWRLYSRLHLRGGTLDDRLTRGGPLARAPTSGSINGTVDSDPRRRETVGVRWGYSRDALGGWGSDLALSLGLRPDASLRVRLEPEMQHTSSLNQFVTSVADASATTTAGRRYVFSTLHQTTLALGARLDWTMAPNLSLQLFARPFVSGGAFDEYKELAAPRTSRFSVYGRDLGTVRVDSAARTLLVDPDGPGTAPAFRLADPDFNVRNFRSNAVLRWEYRPGSTLFVVWQQLRDGTGSLGDFALRRDAAAVFNQPPENILVVKASFWVGR